ncbi:MAG: hypothetical protein INR68_17015 [Methylobacterium mesophilicum]|nr:hypothetical protein [Methylobacterium mesophilicum]
MTALVIAGVMGPGHAMSLQDMFFSKGVCEKFVIGKQTMTKACDGKILNSAFSDHRLGFYFTFKNGGIITFTGYDRPNPTPNTDLIAIDGIIFNVKGGSQTFAATGSCRYGNFAAGYKRVTCKGASDDGRPF